MITTCNRIAAARRPGVASREVAIVLPALILILAICFEIGRYAYFVKIAPPGERHYAPLERTLLEPFALVGIVAALAWIAVVLSIPRR